MNHIELGKYGEALAQKHLAASGYEILMCNYRFLKLELDIVAQKDGKNNRGGS
jgi:putative endonuclease